MGDGQRPRGAQEEDEYNLLCPTIQSVDSNLPPNPLHLPGVPERGLSDVRVVALPAALLWWCVCVKEQIHIVYWN